MGRKKINIDVKKIPIDLVNEPKMLVRETLGDKEDLYELGKSIQECGQIQPILVRKKGERYDLIVGHRRLHASRLVGAITIEAKIIDVSDAEAAIMRYRENNERLDNSPYEEALFIKEMLENMKISQIELSKKLGKSSSYVSQRMALLQGYPCVREAVRMGSINFNQARELLLMPDEKTAAAYVEIVIKGGAKAELIRQWRNEAVAAYRKIEDSEEDEAKREEKRVLVQLQFRKCEMCATVSDPIDLVYMRVCNVCHKTLSSELDKLKGGG